jgi:pilus assembly protein Flp/PilA
VSGEPGWKGGIARMFNSEKGQGLVEYALILVLVAIVVIVIVSLLGGSIGNVFSNIIANL